MTLVYLVKILKMEELKKVTFVIMGGSAKAEERIFCETNYYSELVNFYPNTKFQFIFAGPELSQDRHADIHKVSKKLHGFFYRSTTGDFIIDNYETIDEAKARLGPSE